MLSAFLKMIIIALAATATANAQRLICNQAQVQNPAGCSAYGRCTSTGYSIRCTGPAGDCRSGFNFCNANCRCA
uniref:Hesp-C66 n=1 Tax=Melampsora lini TaxID=5261 RepID=Q2MV27_MELLI|nr:hesp-C66 [Melampsora lini]